MSVASLPKTVTRSVSEASLAPPPCRIELRLFVHDLNPKRQLTLRVMKTPPNQSFPDPISFDTKESNSWAGCQSAF